MSENELKTEKLSMSNTKKEMLQAYSTVVKQLSEKEKNILQPQKITGEKQKTETVKKVETLSTETISRNIDSLKYEIGSLLAKLNSSLDSEVQKYEDIQKAISIKEEELKEIYEIEKSALSLAAFIETQNLKRAEFDDEMAAKKESLIKEIESTRFDWKKEKDEFESIEKEQDEFNKKKRAREKEEYEYGFKREKQLSENKLKDDHQKIEKEFNEKMEQLKILEKFREKGRNLRMLLIVGAGKVGLDFLHAVTDNRKLGYVVKGFLDDSEKPFLDGQYLGAVSYLDSYLSKNIVDDVIIALPISETNKIEYVIDTCQKHSTSVQFIPGYFRFIRSRYNISTFGQFPIISLGEGKLRGLHWRTFKRTIDLSATILLFITVLSWLIPLIGIIIKLTSRGEVIFKQERWGRDNQHFYTYKFRTMIPEAASTDENGKYQQTIKNDPRLTKIGRFLRRSSLDELPQFWNVLKGEMSIVGPRPHPVPLNIESKDKIDLYMLRHLVKPGITGWAQINGYRGEITNKEFMQKRVDHDIWYIENWSPWLDLKIMVITIGKMIKGDPAAY